MTPIPRGFTLIEMAIVLVIITILIGGLAVPLSAQIQARRIAETNKTLEEAKDALVGYAMTHKSTDGNQRPYLPCPAGADGHELTRIAGLGPGLDGSCPQTYGYFPWVDLGGAPNDAWGNRLRYIVTSSVSNSVSGFSSNPNITTQATGGWKNIASTHGCATVNVAQKVPFVLISHGPNGWGALNVNGNTLAAPTSADENENLGSDDTCYVSRAPSKPGSASGEFDDLVTWMSWGALTNRVCPSGGCP
jgi:prepilin-type N-terminal cleavage/methylation domain-containing protein